MFSCFPSWPNIIYLRPVVYAVKLQEKSASNPLYGKGSKKCFALNSHEIINPVVLRSGYVYHFDLTDQTLRGHSIYISADEKGGPIDDNAVSKPINNGHLILHIHKKRVVWELATPASFANGMETLKGEIQRTKKDDEDEKKMYIQCIKEEYMGFEILFK